MLPPILAKDGGNYTTNGNQRIANGESRLRVWGECGTMRASEFPPRRCLFQSGEMMTTTTAKHYPMAEAVRAAYRAGEEDEALEPLVLVDGDGQPGGRIGDGDYVIFYDIRGEREVELTQAFTSPGFDEFPVPRERTPHWAPM